MPILHVKGPRPNRGVIQKRLSDPRMIRNCREDYPDRKKGPRVQLVDNSLGVSLQAFLRRIGLAVVNYDGEFRPHELDVPTDKATRYLRPRRVDASTWGNR